MENDMIMRKANAIDLSDAVGLFAGAIRKMKEDGMEQWDEIYPDREILEKDIVSGQMYLCEIQKAIASAFTLNSECDAEYSNGKWRLDGSYLVVHRLCVNPSLQNQGIGTKTMTILENMLRADGIKAVRLDAFSSNPHALKMYEKLGYIKVGEANWRKGLFYLYEKAL